MKVMLQSEMDCLTWCKLTPSAKQQIHVNVASSRNSEILQFDVIDAESKYLIHGLKLFINSRTVYQFFAHV